MFTIVFILIELKFLNFHNPSPTQLTINTKQWDACHPLRNTGL